MRKKFLLMTFLLAIIGFCGTSLSAQVEITTEQDLRDFAVSVNKGNSYYEEVVTLANDITLTGEWTPIGDGSRDSKTYTGNSFKGTFDGGDHTISGLTITSTSGADAAVGLFGIVDGGTVENLNLTDVNINVASSDLAGAAIGMMLNGATADNITVSGTIIGYDGVGGIVGRLIIDGTISNCINNASVTSSYGGIGGIVGKAYYEDGANTSTFASVTKCTNKGTVTAPMYIGGIAGLARANVTDCINEGAIVGGTQTGGIVGQLIAAGTVSGNENKAKVSGKNHLGGIIGDYSQSNAYTYYNVSIANNINRGELAATEQCAAIMGCNNIDGFTAMTATGNVSYYYVEGLELFGNPEDMVIDETNKFIIPVAKIGDVEYSTLAKAVAAAETGDEIIMLSDATLDSELTLPAGITFNGNGKQINGNIVAAGDLSFVGHTKVTSFNAGYNKPVITISEGACLEIIGTGRMVIGHGATFNINGNIDDAKTADKANLTPSLIMPGASFTGAGVTFNVTNAYISAPSSYCSSSASGTFDFNITNSIWESAGKLAFESQSTAATVNFDLVESVLNTGSHLVFGVSRGEVVIDNSNVNVGTSRQIENQSTMTIKNGSVVNGAVATSSNAKNPGTLIVEDATYAVTGEFSGSDLGTGTLIMKNGASFTAGSITKANIQIDATGMAIGDVINLTANLTNLAGTLEVINNDNLDAEIKDGKIVLVEKPVAKIGDVKYGTLNEALNAAAQTEELTTIQLLAGTHTFGDVKFPATLKNVTIVGADNKATIIKDSKLHSADGNAVTYKGITFDGIVFDNSSILFTGARNGEVVYEDWTIKKCDFRNLQSTDGIAAIHFNLAADETIKNFTFEKNTITNVTSPSNTASGLRLNYVTGDVVIKDNETNNVAFNAVQIINSEVDDFTFEGNILRSNGSSLANLYNVTGENIVITKNQFLANEDQISVSNIEYADVSGNYWGGGAPTNLPEGVVYSSYYTTVESDGTLGGLVELPQGDQPIGYVSETTIWGETWSNARTSYVIKVKDAEGNVMGTSTLNPELYTFNGNAAPTWHISFDPSTDNDTYWIQEWTTVPSIDNMPAKVALCVDGVEVNEGPVKFNSPDDINKIYAATADAEGKLIRFYNSIETIVNNEENVNVVLVRDVTGSFETFHNVTLYSGVEGGASITNTYSADYTNFNKVIVKNGVTLNMNRVYSTTAESVNTIEGTMNVVGVYYHSSDAKTEIKNGGKVTTGGMTIVRYNNNPESGIYIYGDGDDATIEFSCQGDAIGAYSGTFYAEDAEVETKGLRLDYKKDDSEESDEYAQINAKFVDTKLSVSSELRLYKDAALTLNGATVTAGKVQIRQNATPTINIDNSTIKANSVENLSGATWNAVMDEDGYVTFVRTGLAGEGTEANPYLINDISDLEFLRDDVNAGNNYQGKYVALADDIDLNNQEWTPIGNNTNQFQGYFDGNNKTIKNLKVSGSNRYVGLFGYIKGQGMSANTTPSVKDLTLENVNVSGDYFVGGLSGQAYTCNITNVTVKGNVSGVRYVGGLVGHVYTYFKDCHFIGNASCSFDALGGIAGAGDCRAYDCSVIGDITGSNWVGGIVGNGQEGTSAVGCYVKGDVKTSNNYYRGVGGIAGVAGHGYASSEFKNNYFDGEVYLGDVKVPAMIMGLVNANDNASIKATVEGNSWNTDYYDVNTPVYVVAEISSSDASLEDWIAGTSEELTKPRNNNLVMLESDIQYVEATDIEDVTIMKFSEVTVDDILPQIEENNQVAYIDSNADGAYNEGETKYTSLADAYNAATDGQTITLLNNITLSEKFVIAKSITLDGNYKTLTYTGEDRAIDIYDASNNVDNVTIKNITIKFTSASEYCQRGINYNEGGNLTLDNVTVDGSSVVTYAVNLPSKSTGANVTITNSNITGKIALNVWGANAEINAIDSHFTSVDDVEAENYAAVKLNNNGTDSAEGAEINITGGSITAKDENEQPSSATTNATATGVINISETTEVIGNIVTTVAIVTYEGYSEFYGCSTLQEAIDKAGDDSKATVKLLRNVETSELIKVEKAVVLDLNGKTVTANCKKAFEVHANATIKNGTISSQQRCVDTRTAVELTLENLKLNAIEYYSDWGNQQPLTIGGNDNGTQVTMETVEINAGTAGYGIITFVETELTANESAISGYSALYVKPGSDNSEFNFVNSDLSGGNIDNDVEGNSFSTIAVRANNVAVNVDAESTVTANGNHYYAISFIGTSENTTTGSRVTVEGDITANNFLDDPNGNTVKVKAEYADELAAAGYATIEAENGLVSVIKAVAKIGETLYATLQDAFNAATEGQTVTVINDVELESTVTIAAGKVVTLDLNGKTINYNPEVWTYGAANSGTALLTVAFGGDLTIKDSSTEKTGTIDASYTEEGWGHITYDVYGAVMMTAAGDNAENGTAKLTVNGGTLKGFFAAVAGNRNRDNTEITINGGHLTAAISDKFSTTGIEHPMNGKLTINGGTIEGMDGISFRSGTLVITDGTIIGNAPTTAFDADGYWDNNFGACTGHALQIVNRANNEPTNETPNVAISGGNFTSVNTTAVGSYASVNGDTPDTMIDKFITGGTYSSDVTEYLADGYEAVQIDENVYEVRLSSFEKFYTAEGVETTQDQAAYSLMFNVTDYANNEVSVKIGSKKPAQNSSINLVTPVTATFDGITFNVTSVANKGFYETRFKTITISEGVRTLGTKALANMYDLTSVVFPSTLESVGDNCFHGYGDSHKIKSITSYAVYAPAASGNWQTVPFQQCIADVAVLIVPNASSYTEYKESAGWSRFTNILGIGTELEIAGKDDKYTMIATITSMDPMECSIKIGNTKPASNSNAELVIPEVVDFFPSVEGLDFTVTSIPDQAFSSCLYFVGDLVIPQNVRTIGASAFNTSHFVANETVRGTLTLNEGLVSIGSQAFKKDYFKGDLSIPSTVETIASNAFQLASFDGILTINGNIDCANAFGGTGFTELVLVEGVEEIKDSNAFSGMTELKEVVLPLTLQTVGMAAFKDDNAIEVIHTYATEVPAINSIPGNVNYKYAFSETVKANAVLYVHGTSYDDVLKYKNATNEWNEFANIHLYGAVAQIEEVEYLTIQDAINAAQAGETITVIDNVELTETITVAADKEVVFDLNGKVVSYTTTEYVGEAMITNNGNLTINDSAEGGKLSYAYEGGANSSYGFGNSTIENKGVLTINAGTVENTSAAMSHASYAINTGAGATLNVEGGNILNLNGHAVRMVSFGTELNTVNINGGYIEGTRALQVQLPGSASSTTKPAMDLNITGGELMSNEETYNLAIYVFSNGQSAENVSVEISGGTFNGNVAVNAAVTNSMLANAVAITGGTFNGEWGVFSYADDEVAVPVISITGGTFATNYSEFYAADEQYVFEQNENGTYSVVEQTIFTQTTQLNAGWNWFSAYVDIENNGLTMIQNALGTNGIQIKKQNDFSYYEKEYNKWFGSFEVINREALLIDVEQSQSLNIVGEIVNPAEHKITLKQNWTWIGYPLNVTMSMSEAFELAGLEPNDGDIVKCQNEFASYIVIDENTKGWIGDFNMTPGEGFMYYNTSEDTKEFYYSAEGASESETRSDKVANNHWIPNASQYPNNMTMTAMVDIEGGDYEVAAFVDGEVRGSARPIYVEALDSYMLFLTIHGEGVEEMTFKFYDLATGEEYALNDRMNYSDDAIVGSIKEPYMFNRGTTGIGESSLSEINIYPNPTTTGKEINLQTVCDRVEVFNALGVKVAEYHNVDSIDAFETAGIYVIRITDNGDVKHCRLIVK